MDDFFRCKFAASRTYALHAYETVYSIEFRRKQLERASKIGIRRMCLDRKENHFTAPHHGR